MVGGLLVPLLLVAPSNRIAASRGALMTSMHRRNHLHPHPGCSEAGAAQAAPLHHKGIQGVFDVQIDVLLLRDCLQLHFRVFGQDVALGGDQSHRFFLLLREAEVLGRGVFWTLELSLLAEVSNHNRVPGNHAKDDQHRPQKQHPHGLEVPVVSILIAVVPKRLVNHSLQTAAVGHPAQPSHPCLLAGPREGHCVDHRHLHILHISQRATQGGCDRLHRHKDLLLEILHHVLDQQIVLVDARLEARVDESGLRRALGQLAGVSIGYRAVLEARNDDAIVLVVLEGLSVLESRFR